MHSGFLGENPVEALIIVCNGKTCFASKTRSADLLVYIFSKGCPSALLLLVSHKIVLITFN